MKTKGTAKLSLKRETIRALQDDQLGHVAGGVKLTQNTCPSENLSRCLPSCYCTPMP